MKYCCKMCDYIYDEEEMGKEFTSLEDFDCPMCHAPKNLFVAINEEEELETSKRIFKKAVLFSDDNKGVEKDDAKCIDCGICKATCISKCGLNFGEDTSKCLECGQCIITCPTNALRPKRHIERVKKAMSEGKTMVCYTSPAIRVSIGEVFGYAPGTFLQGKLIGLLRKLGFQYVLDTTFGADLTIMEEATELKERLENNGVLPMFTSCCPAWVKYAETYYSDLLPHLSTCKSPIGMEGEIVKHYFSKKMNILEDELFTVAITPCTAKKFELQREEIPGTDAVITVSELADWVKEEQLSFDDIEESQFDSLLGEGSGAGVIFGNTGGVAEAALRSLYYFITGEDYQESHLNFSSVRGYDNVKEATITIEGRDIKVAIVHKISAIKDILEDVKNGVSPYQFIEVMNCQGGCVGGGGQPKYPEGMEKITKEKRIEGLYQRDKETTVKAAYQNPDIQRLYDEFLTSPGSELAHHYLHTSYHKRG